LSRRQLWRSVLALRSFVDRFLDEDDPRRFYVAQVLLYGGTFIDRISINNTRRPKNGKQRIS
jgi:hypothetical protein